MRTNLERRIERLERLDRKEFAMTERQPKQAEEVQPLVYSIKAAVIAGGGAVSRSGLYMAIKAGQLKMFKRGKRSFIFASEFRRWLEEMPSQ